MRRIATEALQMCLEAFRAIDPGRLVAQHLAHDGDALFLGPDRVDLRCIDQVLLVAVGKAALGMYRGASDGLRGIGLPVKAIVISNQCDEGADGSTMYLRGSHPLPDRSSMLAARRVLALLGEATGRTVVIYLISGGASAMVELPLDPAIGCEDMVQFHRGLVHSGLPIDQMNTMRKHFSAVKGGRLAAAAGAAARQYTLLISDVPEDRPDVVGSGPSVPDWSTWEESKGLVAGLNRMHELPASVERFFGGSVTMETPKAAEAIFRRATWRTLASSADLAEAAASLARRAGFEVVIDNGCDNWEYRKAAVYLLDRAERLSVEHPKCCVISVGEVNVRLPAVVGEGGRNQQFALWCACELARRQGKVTVLSAGSDGIDGNSSAAGAVCDEGTVNHAMRMGIDVMEHLERFESAPVARRLGAEIMTGPTGNNLRDLRIILCDQTRRAEG